MKFTSVKKYKGSTFEAELDYERKLYFHADIIVDFNIREGMEVEREELRRMIWASNFRRAYQRALYLLDYRDYSAAEMQKKLTETYRNETLCRAVIDRLTEHGIIDDERYAERLARKLVESKRYGFRRALREITLKGIDKFTAEDALEQYSQVFEENLMELLRTKHSSRLTDKDDRRSIEKVKSALVRYGYSFDEINRCVKQYFEELSDLEESEETEYN